MDTPEGLLALTKFYDGVVVDKFIDPAGLTINSSIEQGKVFRAGNMGHYFGFLTTINCRRTLFNLRWLVR